jgi:PQQ-dependent dehydrogenase (s-GDH family)
MKWCGFVVVPLFWALLLGNAHAEPPQAHETDNGLSGLFSVRLVSTGLSDPWEVAWGADGYLWVTERTAKRVMRVRPSDGAKIIAVMIPEVHHTERAQDGLLGMALHPNLLKQANQDYVYVAYTYNDAHGGTLNRRAKIRRYTYDPGSQSLQDPVDLLTGLPASTDHNAGRLIIGPDQKLYYAVGDQGSNQFGNACNRIRAQDLPSVSDIGAHDWTTYPGKILRLNLDGSIPADNPILNGVQSHIYAYGFRNPQGLVFGPNGILYASDHGPKTDDEINIVQAGGNYGWPHVAGYRDDRAYRYANWSASVGVPCPALSFSNFAIPPSVPQYRESDWNHPNFIPPLQSFFTVSDEYNFRNPHCAEGQRFFICWPTLAPSSLDIHVGGRAGIPGWGHVLLMPSLKYGTVYQVDLKVDGQAVSGETHVRFKTTNRYRDLALHPNQRRIYVVTDRMGVTVGHSGVPTTNLDHRGAILEFRYIDPSTNSP